MDRVALEAFEAACLPLLPECRAFALSLARRSAEADDLVQEAYLRALRAWHTFVPGTNAKAWLFTILRRQFIDEWRRTKRRPTPLPGDELGGLVDSGGGTDGGDDPMAWTDVEPAAVPAAIERLASPFRETVRLRDLDGLSYAEIAEVLDVPIGTVMSRLHRGRESLRRLLVPPEKDPPAR